MVDDFYQLVVEIFGGTNPSDHLLYAHNHSLGVLRRLARGTLAVVPVEFASDFVSRRLILADSPKTALHLGISLWFLAHFERMRVHLQEVRLDLHLLSIEPLPGLHVRIVDILDSLRLTGKI